MSCWNCFGALRSISFGLRSKSSAAKRPEPSAAEALASRCPSGMLKLDAPRVQEFVTAATASASSTLLAGSSAAAGRLALVVDYDLTVSHPAAKEGHHLIRDSPEVPAALRDDLKRFWSAVEESKMHPSLQQFRDCDPASGPAYPHLFWRGTNSIFIRHGLRADVVKRAVMGERYPRIRPGWQDVLNICEAHGIPVVVLSAGLAPVIHEALAQDGITVPSVCQVLANRLIFDEEGRCKDVEPKDPPSSRQGKLHLLAHVPELADRSCILLVGDKPVDAWVDRGLPPLVSSRGSRSLLRFGFLNASCPAEKEQTEYAAAYDVLPKDGGSCSWAPIVALLEVALGR